MSCIVIMSQSKFNICGAGHATHDTELIGTTIGNMWIFKYLQYAGQAGVYCTGQDVLSQAIALQGSWEDRDTAVMKPILENGDRNSLFIDVGSHIGWYTVMAAKLGYNVVAIDGDAENLRVLEMNLIENNIVDLVEIRHEWMDETTELQFDQDIELLKIDIEGNERHVISALEGMIENNQIKHIYLEVSPEFNDTYPALMNRLSNKYDVYYDDGRPFDNDYSNGQINLLCKLRK